MDKRHFKLAKFSLGPFYKSAVQKIWNKNVRMVMVGFPRGTERAKKLRIVFENNLMLIDR